MFRAHAVSCLVTREPRLVMSVRAVRLTLLSVLTLNRIHKRDIELHILSSDNVD